MLKKAFDPPSLLEELLSLRHKILNGYRALRLRSSGDNPAVSQPSGSALRALTAAALTLPGLALSPSLAMADKAPVTLDSAPTVSALAYVPTGASSLSGILAASTSSSKSYRIGCYDNGSGPPAYMKVRIQGKTKAATFNLKATLERNGERQEVIDTKNGDGLFSAFAQVKQGAGEYILTISKAKKKPKDKDNKLKGKTVFQTRQECDTDSAAYTGISKPVIP